MHESLHNLSSRFDLENYFKNSVDLLTVINKDGCFLVLNPYWEEFLGYTLDELIGQPAMRFVHPEDRDATIRYAKAIREGDARRRGFRNRYVTKSGKVRWLEWSIAVDDNLCFSVARDVTRQVEAAENINTQHHLLQAFFEHGNLAVSVLDSERRYLIVSRKWCNDFGFRSPDQVIGRKIEKIFPELSGESLQNVRNLLVTGEAASGENVVRFRECDEWLRWQFHPWLSPAGKPAGAIVFSEFVTDQKEATIEAITQSRLTSLGEITASIAHEINNPLAIIQGTASQLGRRVAMGNVSPEEVSQQLERIERTSVRISKIVKGLRSLARDGSNDPITEIRFTDLLENSLAFCKSRIQQFQIELQTDIAPADLTVACRETEVSQVLINLLNNAAEAILDLPEKWIRISAIGGDQRIHIRITDSGAGIQDSISSQIMRPFFTTKEEDAGMGLGLSISQRLVRGHGGDLAYGLSPDGHTCFSFSLPRSADTSASTFVTRA